MHALGTLVVAVLLTIVGSSGATAPTTASAVADDRVVGAEAFGSCVEGIRPVDRWSVERAPLDEPRHGDATANVGTWRASWGSADPDRPARATVVLLPSTAATQELRTLYPERDEVAGELVQVRRNVLLRSHDGTALPALPETARAAIDGCSSGSLVDAEPRRYDASRFVDCEVPALDPAGIVVEEIRARGIGCDEAARMVKRGAEGDEPWCASFGAGFSCLSDNVCCAIFALYAGGPRGELVVRYGI